MLHVTLICDIFLYGVNATKHKAIALCILILFVIIRFHLQQMKIGTTRVCKNHKECMEIFGIHHATHV